MSNKFIEIATGMIAFSTFLVGLIATIYYTNQISRLEIIEIRKTMELRTEVWGLFL